MLGGRGWVLVAGVAAVAVVVSAVSGCSAPKPPRAPLALTVNGLSTADGVDPDDVSFGWQVGDSTRGAVQSAYRVVVRHAGALVWDSQRVAASDQAFVTYRGPRLGADTSYVWTVTTWDKAGQSSAPSSATTFVTGLREQDWQAQWIRRKTDENDEYTYARKEVTIPSRSPVVRATAYVSADQQYQLSINGTRAGAGPAYTYPDTQYYEALDVTTLVRAGANALALAYHWGGVQKGRPGGSPGAILQLSVWHKDGTHELAGTDGSWRVHRGPWQPGKLRNTEGDPLGFTEHIDGTAEPVGWEQPGFNDQTWPTPASLGPPPVAPWLHLVAQRTRIAAAPLGPVTVKSLPSGGLVADFGRVVTASPSVTFRDGQAGRVAPMRAGFLLDPDGSVSTEHGTQHTDMSYQYVERSGGPQTFQAWDFLAFRYLQIDGAGSLPSADIVAMTRHNAVPDDHAATFSSSDPTVDAVFELARHSALYGSQEQFIDTPTREKSPFLRDSFNISSAAMRAFGEQNLSRRALLEFAASQARYWPDGPINAVYPSGEGKRDIPDFTEIYPEWVWQYWMNTGDRALAVQLLPVVSAIAGYVSRAIDPATGLVTNLPGGSGDYLYGLVDWPPAMRYGYDMDTTVRTTVNALAVNVFRRAADLAEVAGRPTAEVTAARRQADSLRAAMNAHLVRADGIYVDGLKADGSLSPHASQHANAYAVAYGITPPDRVGPVANYAASLGMAMGPQTAAVLLDALSMAGRYDDLVTRLTDRSSPGWANVVAQGGTFTWETWTPVDALGDSMSHGWGSTVLVNIQQAVLGVRADTPGWATFTVQPPASGLTRAAGQVPTVRGPINVSWQRNATAGDAIDVKITVPANTSATVILPGRTVHLDAGTWRLQGNATPTPA